MTQITLRNVGIVAQDPLFSDLNITFAAGDRVGLVAGNGRGKTSLLNCLVGDAEPSSGEITVSRGAMVGFVAQDVSENLLDLTFYEAVRRALNPEVRETETWRVDVVLDGLEVPDDLRLRQVSALSGGWQRLVLLARVWVTDPDILLLDEPTNHLDLEKLLQLETWLSAVAQEIPIVIASHDRAFLDAVTNKTLFLRPEGCVSFDAAYSAARLSLDELDAATEAKFEKEQKEAGRLVRQARKLTNVGINSGSDLLLTKSKQLRQRAAEIEEKLKAAPRERHGDIKLSNSGTHAKVLIALDDVQVRAPDGALLFNTGKLHLFQGDRVVVFGRNGTGKSQFVKLLRKAIIDADSVLGVRVSPTVRLGYTDQALSQLPDKDSAFAFIATAFNVGDQRARALLAGAGFPLEKQSRPIREMSLGQKARLALLHLRLVEPNFYLMDEPTNHIDIAGQEALESEILAHEASCILVSHDRYFTRAVGDRFWVIEKKKLVEVDDAGEWLG